MVFKNTEKTPPMFPVPKPGKNEIPVPYFGLLSDLEKTHASPKDIIAESSEPSNAFSFSSAPPAEPAPEEKLGKNIFGVHPEEQNIPERIEKYLENQPLPNTVDVLETTDQEIHFTSGGDRLRVQLPDNPDRTEHTTRMGLSLIRAMEKKQTDKIKNPPK
jgi:hypothetical protein